MATSRTLAFLERHVWSLSLSLVSALCFAHLASEIRGVELTPFDSEVGAAIVVLQAAHFGLFDDAFTRGEAGGFGAFAIAHEFNNHDAAAREKVGFATARGTGGADVVLHT